MYVSDINFQSQCYENSTLTPQTFKSPYSKTLMINVGINHRLHIPIVHTVCVRAHITHRHSAIITVAGEVVNGRCCADHGVSTVVLVQSDGGASFVRSSDNVL